MKIRTNLFVALLILFMVIPVSAIVRVHMGERPSGRDHIEEIPYGPPSPITPQSPFDDPIYGLTGMREFQQNNIQIRSDVGYFLVGGGLPTNGDYVIGQWSYDFVRNQSWAGVTDIPEYDALARLRVGRQFGIFPGVPVNDIRVFSKQFSISDKPAFMVAMRYIDNAVSLSNGLRVAVVDIALSTDQIDSDMVAAMHRLDGKVIFNVSNGNGAFPSELRSQFDNMVVTQGLSRSNTPLGSHIATLRDTSAYGERVQFNATQTITGTDTAGGFSAMSILAMLSGNPFLPLSQVNDLISNTSTLGSQWNILNGYAAYKAAVNFTTPPIPVTKLEILGPNNGVINQGLTFSCGTPLPANPRFEWRVKPVTRTDEGDLVSREPVLRSIGFAVAGDFLIGLKVFDANSNLFGIGSKAVSITDPTEPVQISIIGTTEVIVGEGVAYEVVGSGFDPVSSTWTIDGVIKANGQRFDPAIFFNVGINFSQVHLLKVTARDKRTGQFVSADLLVTAHIRDHLSIVKAVAIDRSRLGKRNRLNLVARNSRPDGALLQMVALDLDTHHEFSLQHVGGNVFKSIGKDIDEPLPRRIQLIIRKDGFTIGFSGEISVRMKVK